MKSARSFKWSRTGIRVGQPDPTTDRTWPVADLIYVGIDTLRWINEVSDLRHSFKRSICRAARGRCSGVCQRPGHPHSGLAFLTGQERLLDRNPAHNLPLRLRPRLCVQPSCSTVEVAYGSGRAQKPSSARPTQLKANRQQTAAATDAIVAKAFAKSMTTTFRGPKQVVSNDLCSKMARIRRDKK